MAAGTLNFASVPSANLSDLRERLAPFLAHLSSELGLRVRMRVPSSYGEVLDGMLLDEWDLVIAGPRLWINAKDRGARYLPLVRPIRRERNEYLAAIYVRKDSNIQRLDQLRRRRVAFVSTVSTAGFIVPRAALSRAGLALQALGGHHFVGSHQACLAQVLNGRAEAACSFAGALESFSRELPALPDELRSIWTSDPIPNEVWALSQSHADAEPSHPERLRNILVALHESPQGRQALEAMHDRIQRFEAVDEAVYEAVRPMLRRT